MASTDTESEDHDSMAQKPVRRHGRAAARMLKRLVKDPRPVSSQPVLSVVVPYYDSFAHLASCLDSLVQQTCQGVEVVLVDDGSTDGSHEIAERYVAEHSHIVLVEQGHQGVAVARDTGFGRSRGRYVAFCDADDEVPPGGYERLVKALEESGSDLAIGSVSMEAKGLHREPAWARRSNARRRLGVRLEEAPEILANLLPGTRVFRRSFLTDNGFSFASSGSHSVIFSMVQALAAARALDIIASVVYRWGWREDGRSLLQHTLRDKALVQELVASMHDAGELLASRTTELQQHLYEDLLHTRVPDLVQAAVCREDGYWETLGSGLRRLVSSMLPSSLAAVPVESRMLAWLCAHDERPAAESFLEHAFRHQNGLPFRVVDGRARIVLPSRVAAVTDSARLSSVSDSDLCYRTRLENLRWTSPGTLHLEGGALVEYIDDSVAPGTVTLGLRDSASSAEVVVATRAIPLQSLDAWANRPNEEHTGAAFEADVDIASLPVPAGGAATFHVTVHRDVGAFSRAAPFQSRRVTGSAGLLERSVSANRAGEPVWEDPRGLSLKVAQPADERGESEPAEIAGVVVDELLAEDHSLVVTGHATEQVELALVGAQGRTAWVRTSSTDVSLARLSVCHDPWGLGAVPLPTGTYALVARLRNSSQVAVKASASLRRALPVYLDSGPLLLHPGARPDGSLTLRITPGEWRDSGPAYLRNRLRDREYPSARAKSLLDAVLFETFAGRGGGDNPGALCSETAGRDLGLDLVFAVIDRSIPVPPGSRAVVRGSHEWFDLLGRARYLVTNALLPPFFGKRDDQVYVQTWHGSPLKRIAHDRLFADIDYWHHIRLLRAQTPGWDYLVSQSPFSTRVLREAFEYGGQVLEVGYPRNDLLFSPQADEVRRRIRTQLGVPAEARVILYAPTWRDNLRKGRVFDKVRYLDCQRVVEQVDGSVILVRGHHTTIGDSGGDYEDRRIVDVTRYPDIAPLYLAADVLVTDYSSAFFDFAGTDKPMIFLAPDLTQYRDESRGLYLDYEGCAPGPVTETTREVIDVLLGADEYAAARRKFREEFAPLDDGHASERVIDALMSTT